MKPDVRVALSAVATLCTAATLGLVMLIAVPAQATAGEWRYAGCELTVADNAPQLFLA